MTAATVAYTLAAVALVGMAFLAGWLVGERTGYMAAVRWLEKSGTEVGGNE